MVKKIANEKLKGMRMLVCGKGGSGKSTIVTLMANVLDEKGYKTLALDGDASNPQGLLGLMFGLKEEESSKALIDFFGGIKVVTCPVDNPSPLTRLDDPVPVPKKKIDILKEISPEYFIKRKGITLFQAGKIKEYGQGCDGPIEKVVRDFIIKGDYVNLIDVKAGVEHFGRRISDNMDIILLVLDPTFESISIAKRVNYFCKDMKMKNFRLVLNKIRSEEIKSEMINKLGELKDKIIGTIQCDPEIIKSGLEGTPLGKSRAFEDVKRMVEKLEEII